MGRVGARENPSTIVIGLLQSEPSAAKGAMPSSYAPANVSPSSVSLSKCLGWGPHCFFPPVPRITLD